MILKSIAAYLVLFSLHFNYVFANTNCGDHFTSAELKSDLETKLDPDNRKYERLGWGKVDSRIVGDFKSRMRSDENYNLLFLPAKFDLVHLDRFAQVADAKGMPEVIQFFGEMLRMMDQKQMKDQLKSINEIASAVSYGTGFLNALSATINAGNREFKWSMAGGHFTVEIGNSVRSRLGW